MPIIFVANLGRNTTDRNLFDSMRFQALLSKYQAPVIEVGLFDLEMKKIIDGCNPEDQLLTWGSARDYPGFGILGQQEIQTYLEDFYAQLDTAERLADLAFSERSPSNSVNGQETGTPPPPPRKRHSTNG